MNSGSERRRNLSDELQASKRLSRLMERRFIRFLFFFLPRFHDLIAVFLINVANKFGRCYSDRIDRSWFNFNSRAAGEGVQCDEHPFFFVLFSLEILFSLFISDE